MFYGRGAGGAPRLPPCSAIWSRSRATGWPAGAARASPRTRISPALPMGRTVTRYHVSLDVADKAGVLAAVAQAFASQDVSISSVRQDGRGDDASLVLVTHTAPDAALAATVEQLRELDVVRAVASVMRVEGET